MRLLAATAIIVALSTLSSVPGTAQIGHIESSGGSDKGGGRKPSPPVFPFSGAQPGTTYYGGTYWAPDSARWEALEDSCWTFDTGVGSHYNHAASYVNPYKNTALHAYMEGWIGIDRTYSDLSYFRRLGVPATGEARWAGGPVCVGSLHPSGNLGGGYSFWCGVFPSEASALCYKASTGYGNNWFVCMGASFTYNGAGTAVLEFDYACDTEPGFDYAFVMVDTSGGSFENVTAATYSGNMSDTDEQITLIGGYTLPWTSGDVDIKFCVSSDPAYSDEDGLYPTTCGAFAVDNISISGGITSALQTFEASSAPWALLTPLEGPGGEWSDIVHLNDLPPTLTSCPCAMSDSVMVFNDLLEGGHNAYTNNLAASPWIDLGPDGYNDSRPGKFIEVDIYAELPVLNYMFVQFNVQWYPYVCPETGDDVTSPWTSDGFMTYYGGVPRCSGVNSPTRKNLSAFVSSDAEQIRIAVGVVSLCSFFAECTGVTNTTPWFDNVKLGVYGNPMVPMISAQKVDVPQDNFPENGTLGLGSAGRLDSNNINWVRQAGPGTSLGDTLVVHGGMGEAEVYVQFAVTPGPGVNPIELNTFFSNVTYEETRYGQNWYSAQMDTAEVGASGALVGHWMTTFIEGSAGFSGSDTDTDPFDLDPNGAQTRPANDIFRDDLFTPGTRVNMFFKSKFIAGSTWYTDPDTSDGNWYEWECLPSSMAADSTFNCVLYVDHFSDYGAQPIIEEALTNLLGTGSANFEQTNWDRWDVQAPSSRQMSFGRPLNTEYGATVVQALGYRAIIWNSGNLSAFNFTKEDADVLMPWITLDVNANNLYLSGDDIVASPIGEGASDPSAAKFIENIAGVQLSCSTYRRLDCPSGKPADGTACVNIDPVGGAKVAGSLGPRLVDHLGQGNGCPARRSFDVLSANPSPDFGVATPDEIYSTQSTSPAGAYASIAIDGADDGPLSHRIVTDGVSVHYRRNAPVAGCTYGSSRTVVEERLDEVLTFLGYGGGGASCTDPTTGISIGDDPVRRIRTSLTNFAPNPLLAGATGRIEFSMAREGKANVEIFDVNGRLVTSVFDGVALEGVNEVFWDGADSSGRQVASGVYFYRLRALDRTFSKKLVLIGR